MYTPYVYVGGGGEGGRYDAKSLLPQHHVPVLGAKARRRMAETKACESEGCQ